jgi:hypothetical protein
MNGDEDKMRLRIFLLCIAKKKRCLFTHNGSNGGLIGRYCFGGIHNHVTYQSRVSTMSVSGRRFVVINDNAVVSSLSFNLLVLGLLGCDS